MFTKSSRQFGFQTLSWNFITPSRLRLPTLQINPASSPLSSQKKKQLSLWDHYTVCVCVSPFTNLNRLTDFHEILSGHNVTGGNFLRTVSCSGNNTLSRLIFWGCSVRFSTGTSAILIEVHRGFTQSLEVNVRDNTSICPFETLTSSPFICYRSLRRYIATDSVAGNL
jgi:hypothetical protein